MDRQRLKEVHQTDLTESRINEDFLDWLKSNGPTWLLVILVAVCVFIGVQRYKMYKVNHRNEAWAAFFEARLPGSYEDVANSYEDVGQLANLSRLQAAEELLRLVQADMALDATLTPEDLNDPENDPASEPLTEELRDQYLTRADGLYEQVIAADDNTMALTLYAVNAYNGRAAIAESRGDGEAARDFYLEAADRAESAFPAQAAIARHRAEDAANFTQHVTIPAAEDAPRRTQPPLNRNPASPVEPDLMNLITPDETGG